MSEAIEHAREGLEHAHHHAEHGEHHPAPGGARGIAVLIAILAALLAICDMGAKSAQTLYLTHHIALSNDWSFYQAKNARAVMRSVEANMLESLPTAQEEAVQKKIAAARADNARLRDEPGADGMKQLAEKARGNQAQRDHYEHQYHLYEMIVGALQIAIVLASVSVVTRMAILSYAAGIIGLASALAGLAVRFHMI
jgi:hypothetical protein